MHISAKSLPAQVWTVSALCLAVADALNARFNPVEVAGELSGVTRAASGHWYFSLKDASGQIRCAMFRRAASLVDFQPREGERVQVTGRLGVYESRGDLQLVVESMRRVGEGDLYAQFARIKAKLEAEGLFDPARKRALQPMPRRIGVVTSLGAAALHDVATALARRVPHIPVVIAPALVQGAQAPATLQAALQSLYGVPDVDVILLVRGGGSIDDLWAFNDEGLARTLCQSPVPVVSGVGHEVDFTIADFCADVRAPTPTAAAEICAVAQAQLLDYAQVLAQRLANVVGQRLDTATQRLDWVQSRLGRPSTWLHREQGRLQHQAQALSAHMQQGGQAQRHQLSVLNLRLQQAVHQSLARAQQDVVRQADRLQLLDPKLVLSRGYAWLHNEAGATLSRVAHMRAGESVRATLVDGEVDLTVVQPRPV